MARRGAIMKEQLRCVVVCKRKLCLFLVTAVTLVCAVAACLFTSSAALYSGSTTRKVPIYRVETEEKKVAISFDAAWGADKTDDILKTVEEYDIKANFFVVGFWAEKYPDKLKKLHDSGRIEIGVHSNTHPHMPKLSREKMKSELTVCADIIKDITGKQPDLFRAPFGDYSDALLEVAGTCGFYTIQWDVDSLDWKGLSSGEIAARVLKKATNGSIILLHNDGKNTVAALPAIIMGLKAKGFEFVNIGDLIYRENYTVRSDGAQIRS